MSKRIEVPIALETSGIRKGATDAERALEDLEDAVQDAGRGGAKDLDKLEDELKDVQRQTERTADSADDIGDGMKRGFKRAEEGAQEFKDEAAGTAREAAASFDGSAESIGDAFQEVAANAFAGFGPAGAIAGIAAAAGIGLAAAGFESVDEASAESKERAAEWAQAFIDAGSLIISSAQVTAGMIDIATDGERYDKAKENAKNWGVDVSTAMRAMAGDATALRVAEEQLIEKGERLSSMQSKTTEEALQTRLEWENGTKALTEQTGEMDRAAEAARNVSDGLIDMVNSAQSAAEEVDEVGNKLYTLPDGTQVVIDANTGLAHQNLDRFKGDLDGVPEVITSTVKVQVDSRAWDNWRPTTKRGGVQAYRLGGNTMSWE